MNSSIYRFVKGNKNRSVEAKSRDDSASSKVGDIARTPPFFLARTRVPKFPFSVAVDSGHAF